MPRGPVEYRSALLAGVDAGRRLIELVAAPYDQDATVEYRGRLIRESIAPGAFAGVEARPSRVKVNRDHDVARLVGRAVQFEDRAAGLVATVHVSATPLGDETLALAADDVLSGSVGMAVPLSGMQVRSDRRRVSRAWLVHLALVPTPAYEGARVLSVRNENEGAVGA